MTTDNSRTQTSGPSPNNVDKKEQFKRSVSVSEIFRKVESIQVEVKVKNVLTGEDNQLSDKLREC
jgi:hypothetical protein